MMKAGQALILFAAVAVAVPACRTPPRSTPTPPVMTAKPAKVPVKAVEPACRPGPEVNLPLPEPGTRLCVVDVGSRNVKLLVAQSSGQDPRGLYPVRTCRARLQLGEKTQDASTRQPKDLAEAHRLELAGLVQLYQNLCVADGGRIVGAFATEWARKVTNLPVVIEQVRRQAGVLIEAIPQEREGVLGYLAATKGQRGRVVLDFGSRSFQISVWPKGADAPYTIGLPLGIDEAGERFFDPETVANFAAGEKAFVAELRTRLASLPEWKVNMKRGVGRLNRTLVSLGENGDVALAIDGKLWTKGKRPDVVNEAGYLEHVAAVSARVQPLFGRTMGSYDVASLKAWRRRLQTDQSLFNALRAPDRRKAFGHKMLAFPVLVNFIAAQLSVDKLVLVPDELAMGVLVEGGSANAAVTKR